MTRKGRRGEREQEIIFQLLVHSPHGHTSWRYGGKIQEDKISSGSRTWLAEAQALSHLQIFTQENQQEIGSKAGQLQLYSHGKQRFNRLQHNANPHYQPLAC